MRAQVLSPFELYPVELLYPERYMKRSGEAQQQPPQQKQPKSAVQSMESAYRELSEKSGLAILGHAIKLTGGNVIFGQATQKPTREPKKRGYHKDTFYMPTPEERAPGEYTPLELDRTLKQAFNIVVVPSNIKYITKDFLVRHGFTLQDLIQHCEVPIEELKLARILFTFDDLLDLKFKARDFVTNRQLFSTDKLAALYGVLYEDLRQCKRFSLTAFDLAECQFYPNELMALEFSFDPMVSRGYIDKRQLAKLKFSLADMRLLGFCADHAVSLRIDSRDARKLFKWDVREFEQFCPSEESSSEES